MGVGIDNIARGQSQANALALANIAQELNDIQHIDANAELVAARGGSALVGDRLNLEDDIKASTQTPSFNADGTISQIVHKNSSNVALRTDVFTYDTNTITEVRTLTSGAAMTYIYHLDTLVTEVV